MGNSAISKVEKKKDHIEVDIWKGSHTELCAACSEYPQEPDLRINS